MKRHEIRDALQVAVNSCKDVTTLGRFAPAVDPVGWVNGLQSHLEEALRLVEPAKKRARTKNPRRSESDQGIVDITIGDYSQ